MEHKRPQVLEVIHAVGMRQAQHGYEVLYLEIPSSEIYKYAISAEKQPLDIAEAKVVLHFKQQVAGFR